MPATMRSTSRPGRAGRLVDCFAQAYVNETSRAAADTKLVDREATLLDNLASSAYDKDRWLVTKRSGVGAVPRADSSCPGALTPDASNSSAGTAEEIVVTWGLQRDNRRNGLQRAVALFC